MARPAVLLLAATLSAGATSTTLAAEPVAAPSAKPAATAAATAASPANAAPVRLPKDFRSWSHVRSMVVTDPEEGMYGFHDVYANPSALRTLRAGKGATYPDGATFVVAIAEPRQEKGTVSAGERQRDVVQVKDRRATATGGWRFASFDPSGKPIAIDPAACAACHAQAAATDMVFTRYRP